MAGEQGISSGTANLISQGVSLIVGTISGISDSKKQRELQEYLSGLSIESQERIASRMLETQSSIEREKILFQELALNKNLALTENMQKDKNISFMILGGSIVFLGVVIFLVKRKK